MGRIEDAKRLDSVGLVDVVAMVSTTTTEGVTMDDDDGVMVTIEVLVTV